MNRSDDGNCGDRDWLCTVDGSLHAERVPLEEIARRFGTPTYVYSRQAIESAFGEFDAAAAGRDALICYALKANPNLAVIDLLARAGAGFDIVSGGELARVIAAGGDPAKTVFSGVGKTLEEMRLALRHGVRCFNVESIAELDALDRVAGEEGVQAPVSLRVNPDVDARTHPYISTGLRENKFGIAHDTALATYRRAAALPNLRIAGIDCHIGSQITELDPFIAALDRVLDLVARLRTEGIVLHHLDLGGGLGIRYHDEQPPARRALIEAVFDRLDREPHGRAMTVMFEFGRAIVGNAGVLLSRVQYLKETADKRFAIVDAAMNDLLRPALYGAYHDIVPVRARDGGVHRYDVVGPVCESGDWLGKDRDLALAEGDLIAITAAGAYGMAMSSNYNSRPRAAEVIVDGGEMHEVRRRESLASLYAGETLLPASPARG